MIRDWRSRFGVGDFGFHIGLVAKGDNLTGFAIAGKDGKFVLADAVIVGTTVLVSSPAVSDPVAVRYGWNANPACNLYNKENLPAVPFRTDSKFKLDIYVE